MDHPDCIFRNVPPTILEHTSLQSSQLIDFIPSLARSFHPRDREGVCRGAGEERQQGPANKTTNELVTETF